MEEAQYIPLPDRSTKGVFTSRNKEQGAVVQYSAS